MTITLAAISRVTLRTMFLPMFRRQMADMGIALPKDWNPTDEELDRLNATACRVFHVEREENDGQPAWERLAAARQGSE